MARKPLEKAKLDESARRIVARPLQERSLPIESLVANPRNPRSHPEMQLRRLEASIRQFGQPRPVLVRRENRMIIAGHGVKLACERAGLTQILAVLWDVDQPTADAFMLGDNRLAQLGSDDADRIRELLRELGLADVEAIGYSAAEIDELLADASDDIDVLEIQTGDVADRFWVSVRGPLKDQAAALKRLQTVMADLPEIEVELGTTPA
jgi:ParB-like chromosome segregation protein Spo0J